MGQAGTDVVAPSGIVGAGDGTPVVAEPPPAAPAPAVSGAAKTSLVLGLVGLAAFVFFAVVPVLAVVFGVVALRRIGRSGGRLPGRRQAITGITLGLVEIVAFVAAAVTGSLTINASVGEATIGHQEYEGNGIAFDYPANWDELSGVQTEDSVGDAEDLFDVTVARAARDLVSVKAYRLDEPVDPAEVPDALTEVMTELAGEDGLLTGPTPVVIDGVRGYQFETSIVAGDGEVLHTTHSFVFHGTTEYEISCQHHLRGAQVRKACDQVLGSFRTT